MFYRNGNDGEWKYFTGTQTSIACNDFSRNWQARNAFADYQCVRDVTAIGEPELMTVREFFSYIAI